MPCCMSAQKLLVSLVTWSARRFRLVLTLALLVACLSIWSAATRLGVTTDIGALFAQDLPWRKQEAASWAQFPQFRNLIVAVVDARIPEEADATAEALAAALQGTADFTTVRRPDALPFYHQEGLLFLDRAVLSTLLDHTIDAQPFLGQLVADPSARGLLAALSLVAVGVQRQADLGPYDQALRGFHVALAAAAAGHPEALSWQRLLAGPVANLAGPYRFVLFQPKLDFKALQPGGRATAAIRAAAAKLEFVRSGDAHVRITGAVPLADDEFQTAARGAAAGLAGSLFLVTFWLFLAVRSWRFVVPIVLTLLTGLLVTTAFASLAVGTLNLISVAFAVLFVGIAVDFSIQFAVRFRALRDSAPDSEAALAATAGRVGLQILVAAAATAAGFLAFVPTSFTGVAELGLIAGAGMIVALLCTITVLPAALTLLHPSSGKTERGFSWAAPLDRVMHRLRLVIIGCCLLLAASGATALLHLRFDSNALDTKDPNTESMRTLASLMDNPVTSPFSVELLRHSVAEADATASQLRGLPDVGQMLDLSTFVPADQQAKLALVTDAANILGPTLAAPAMNSAVTATDLRLAVQSCFAQISHVLAMLPRASPLAQIAGDLQGLQSVSDSTLLSMNTALTRFLLVQLSALRTSLTAQPVTLQNLPEALRRDWLSAAGIARLQVMPKNTRSIGASLDSFVSSVRSVTPDAGGTAVSYVSTSQTIISAFKRAAIAALIGIAVILMLVLRRPLDAGLAMAPLVLAALLTALAAVLLRIQLNFANIIALPLLLGVGLSFNIYYVMNWRRGEMPLLRSPTSRAIVFSALTTGTAFGSLALSHHPGTASMGDLLLISLAAILFATLVFCPALLASVKIRRMPPSRS